MSPAPLDSFEPIDADRGTAGGEAALQRRTRTRQPATKGGMLPHLLPLFSVCVRGPRAILTAPESGRWRSMSEANLERRQFFSVLAATGAGLSVLGCQAAAQTPAAAAAPADEWARVRAEFSVSPDYVHLAGFLL